MKETFLTHRGVTVYYSQELNTYSWTLTPEQEAEFTAAECATDPDVAYDPEHWSATPIFKRFIDRKFELCDDSGEFPWIEWQPHAIEPLNTYTIVGLNQDTGQPFGIHAAATSVEEAVIKAANKFAEATGEHKSSFRPLSCLYGQHEELIFNLPGYSDFQSS